MSAGSSSSSSRRRQKPKLPCRRNLSAVWAWLVPAICYYLLNALLPTTQINQWPLLALAQQNTVSPNRNSLISSASERHPFAPARLSQPAIATTTTTTTSGDSPYGHNISPNTFINQQQQQQQQQSQPKSLKFTLIAGKYWKFHIKPSSLHTSHNNKELRLHRNVSSNNFIIDDDGWFQYNHQQQQLFAWPSLDTKPATYYFVLLPSGIDFEADGENVISGSDIVANILIELIRPLYSGPKFNIDQIIDHKFSLDYMHRHSSYPLLLNQIISIFETLTTRNNTASQNTSNTALTSLLLASQLPSNRLTVKLNEFLLIDSSYSPDGEWFSISWSLQSSLINNTVTQITECRLAFINDIVSRLSSPSLGYQSDSDKFVIYYSLELPTVNPNAIAPTERGNYALKLTLNGPCRKEKTIDDLAVAPSTSNILVGLTSDIDDQKSSNISDRQAPSTTSTTTTQPTTINELKFNSDQVSTPTLTSPVSIVTTTDLSLLSGSQINSLEPNTKSVQLSEPQQDIVSSQSSAASVETSTLPSFTQLALDTNEITTPASISNVNTTSHPTEPTISSTSVIPQQVTTPKKPSPPPISHPSSTEPTTSVESTTIDNKNKDQRGPHQIQVFETDSSPFFDQNLLDKQQQQQQRPLDQSKPQVKSFASFLDLPQVKSPNQYSRHQQNIVITTSTMATNNSTNLIDDGRSLEATIAPNMTETSILKSESTVPTASLQDSSINDDLIGILNEVTDYLVSVAVPASIIVGIILVASILLAISSLCLKRRRSKELEVGNRFKFRYESERRQFLKNGSEPVIIEADQRSLSMGGTPRHKVQPNQSEIEKNRATYLKMTPIKTDAKNSTSVPIRNVPSSSRENGTNFFDMHAMKMPNQAAEGAGLK